MRVLATVNSLDLGGTQLNAVDFARRAADHGVDSVIVGFKCTLPDSGPTLVEVARDAGVELRVLDEGVTIAPTAKLLREVADEFGADIVHGYGGWNVRPAFWGPCRFGQRPLVITVYEMYMPPTVYPRAPVIVGTQYLDEEQRVARPGRVHFISPPVDLVNDVAGAATASFIADHGIDNGATRVVIVSRLDAMKTPGIRHAIRSMEQLGRGRTQLVIVGSGEDETELRHLGEQVNRVVDRTAVVFTGALADPRAAYASADVVIGMGGSAARALAFGRSLVVTGEHDWFRTFDRSSSPLLFRNSFWSDAVEPDPVGTLVSCLEPLLDDPSLRDDLGRFGREFAERNFSLDAMTRRLIDVYDDALSNHRRSDWFRDTLTESGRAVRRLGRGLSDRLDRSSD